MDYVDVDGKAFRRTLLNEREIERVTSTRVSKWTLLLRIKLLLHEHDIIQLLLFTTQVYLREQSKFTSKMAKGSIYIKHIMF